MTTIVPPGSPAPTPPQATPAPIANVQTPPAGLAQLGTGTRLEGVVLLTGGTTQNPQVQVQTTAGVLTLETVVVLPKDAKVVLQILTQSSPPQVLIAAVNGKPPVIGPKTGPLPHAGQQGGLAGGLPGGPQGVPTAQQPATVSLTVGTATQAILVRAVPPADNTAKTDLQSGKGLSSGRATLGGTLQGKTGVEGAHQTPSQGQAPSARGGPQAPGQGALAALASVRSAATAPTSPLPLGTQIPIRIAQVQPLSGQIPPPLQAGVTLAAGQTATGTVIPGGGHGHALVQTAGGTLSIATRAALPPGTAVVFEITGPPKLPMTAEPPRTSPLLERGWPGLDEAMRVFAETDPTAHRHLATVTIPRADSTLAMSILSFLAALRGGEIAAWMGESPMRTLQRTRPDLAAKLDGDFQQRSRLADDPGGGDWRIALIPFGQPPDIQQIRILTRRQARDEDDPQPANDSTRFVIDVDLSNVGRMQLDGLVRDKDKRVDLMVRSDRPLPARMRDEIRRIFAEANDIAGIGGIVGFQSTPANFIEIDTKTILPDHPTLIV